MAIKKEVTTAEQAEQKFTIPKLQKYAFELFGVPTSTFVGATYGLEGEYTVEEIKARIAEWKDKEAK